MGENVAAGAVTFDRTAPGILSIRQATDRAIINWQDFSIGAGDLTRFIQPSANAAALNRVLGGNPSSIYGTLQANGQLILLNPAGIIVGPNGRIDAKGFIASTLNVTDDDFMGRARLTLSGQSRASVKNAGVLKAGNVYLVAREVENAGTIRASNAGLVAGTEVVMGDSGQGVAVLYVGQAKSSSDPGKDAFHRVPDLSSGNQTKVRDGVESVPTIVKNSGLIEAAMAELRAAGENPYALAIRNSGIIRATTVLHEGGKIVLKADSGVTLSNGTLDASGVKGGEVQVLGSRVGLEGSAVVDVSGENGGGTALIGGDFQGKNAYVKNAERTFVGRNTEIRADAKESGDGGKVIVWSDDLTAFYGTISAKGAAKAVTQNILELGKDAFHRVPDIVPVGNEQEVRDGVESVPTKSAGRLDAASNGQGGFVEVSGKENLAFDGKVNVGFGGTVLLDPRDLTIQASGANDGIVTSAGVLFGNPDTLTDVTISATAITSLTGSFSVYAHRDLTINAPLHLTEQTPGEVVEFFAGDDLTINAAMSTAGASMEFRASNSGGADSATATLTIAAPVGSSSTGSVTFGNEGGSGGIRLGDNVTSGAQSANVIFGGTPSVAVTLIGNSTLTGAIIAIQGTLNADAAANNRQLTLNANESTQLNGVIGGTTALGSLTTDAAGTTAFGASGTAVTTTGAQTYNDAVTLAAGTTFTSSSSGNISFNSMVNNAFALTANTAGATRFIGVVGGGTPLASVTTDAAGTTSIKANITTTGAQTYNDDVVIGANVTIAAPTAAVTFAKTVNADLAGNNRALTINNTSGTTTFTGAVGGTQRLGTFTSDATGTTKISGGTFASDVQAFNDAVSLGASATLTGTTVTFGSTVNGTTAASQALTVNASGVTTFSGTVGATTSLSGVTTDSAGSTTISANITSATQAYNDPVTIGANVTVTSTSTVAFNNTLNGDLVDARTLTVNATGATTFGGTVGGTAVLSSLTTDSAGSTVISGSSLSATTLTIADAVTISASTLTLTGTTVTLSGTVNGSAANKNLVINASGTSTISGIVGGTTALGSVTTDAPGTTVLSSSISTSTASGASGDQAFNDFVTVSGTPTLTATGAGADVTFAKTVNGAASVTINAAGIATFNSTVGATTSLTSLSVSSSTGTIALNGGSVTATTQTYSGATTLGVNTTLTGTTVTFGTSATINGAYTLGVTATTTSFGAAIGGSTPLSSVTTTAATTLRSVSTTGVQSYGGAVTLGAAATLSSSGAANITFSSTVGGAFALTTSTGGGTTVFNGAVSGLASINVTGATTIGTTSISTTGAQTYGGAMTLNANTTLTSTSSGAITFSGTVNGSGARTLAVTTAGTTTFSGIIGESTPLTSLTTDNGTGSDTTVINTTAITTTGAQTYGDDVTLSTGTTLTSNSNGNVTFTSTINGAQTLTVNTSGATTFSGRVGGTTALTSLTTDSGGTLVFNAAGATATPTINTTGAQTYNDNATLSAATVLTSTGSGNITLGGTVNGAQALTLNTGGAGTFSGAVGGSTQLTSITTDATGTTAINTPTVRATTQSYNDDVSIQANPTFTGATVAFTAAVDADEASNNRQVTVNAATTTFSGTVGTASLGALTTDSSGTTTISGVNVTATTVRFNDAVTVTGTVTVTAITTTFASTVNGAAALTVDANGTATATFGSTVGATTALTSLTIDAGSNNTGTVYLTGNVSTTGAQTYNDAVVLAANTTLTSTGGSAIALNRTVNADLSSNNRTLTIISNAGATTLGANVGGAEPLSSITTDAGGTLSIGGSIVRAGTITFNDPTTLTASTTLTGVTLTLAGTVNGAFNLTLSGTGTTTVSGIVGGVSALVALTSDNGGTTAVSANITTTGAQTYSDAVTVTGPRTLAAGAEAITFNSTINGAADLTVSTTGATVFNGAVGGTTALTSLTTAGAGTLTVGAAITTTGNQTYAETMALSGNVTLTGATPSFQATEVTGNGYDLTLAFSNGVTLDAGFSGLRHLTTNGAGTTTINNATLAVTGRIVFNTPVALSGGAITLHASDITLGGTVDGAQTLTLTGTGVTTIGGVVGGTTAPTTLTSNGGGATILGANVSANQLNLSADLVTLSANSTLSVAGTTTLGNIAGNGKQLQITGGFMNLNGSVSGLSYFYFSISSTVTFDATGATEITVSTSGDQTYGGNLVLTDATTTFTSTGGGTINFPGAGGTLDGSAHDIVALTVNTAGLTRFPGVVGGTARLASLTTDSAGSTLLESNITVNNAFTFNDAVKLGANVTLTSQSNGAATFASTVNGANATDWNLIVATSGATTFSGAVGTTFDLGNLTTNGGGTTAINGGTVTVSGTQSYTAETSVTLGADTALNGATLTIGSVPIIGNDARDLNLNFTGTTTMVEATFSETAGQMIQDLRFLSGTTSLAGTIETTGMQVYVAPVTLTGNTTLTSTGAGSTGNITFTGTVNGNAAGRTLTVNTDGTATFVGEVGGVMALGALTTDLNAGTDVDERTLIGANITTAGSMAFNDPTFLTGGSASYTITSGGSAVSFNSTLDAFGNRSLVIANGAGTVTFSGDVGNRSATSAGSQPIPLFELQTTGTGAVTVGGSTVKTTGNQSYGGTITLGANTKLAGNTPTFAAGGVNGSGSNFNLTLDFSGTTALTANFINIGKLTTGGGGSTTLTGSISTTASQTYGDSVSLLGSTTLTSTGVGTDGSIVFGSTVNGAQSLTVNGNGVTTFVGAVGGATPLTSLTTDAAGTTVLNTASINVNGPVLFNDAVSLGSNLTIDVSSSGNGITFQSTLNGAQTLTMVLGTGTANFMGAVGGVTPLTSLTVNNAGGDMSIYGGSIVTSGSQSYTVPVKIFLGANTTLTGSSITFPAGGFDGNDNRDLTLNFTGTTSVSESTFKEAAGDRIQNLSFGAGGATRQTGTTTTTGTQTYNSPVTLTGNTSLTSTGAGASGNIAFNSQLNSDAPATPRTLTLVTSGTQTFGGAVGGISALGALDTGTGGITISGGSINTGTENQQYDGTITLGANTTLTGGTPTFAATALTGAGKDLTLNFTGLTILDGTFTGIKNLTTANGGTTRINGDLSTTGTQTYDDSVTIAGGAAVTRTLTSTGSGNSGNITFVSTLDATTAGNESLTLVSNGTTKFGGAVGLGSDGVFGGTDNNLLTLTTDAGTAGGTTLSGGLIFATTVDFNDRVSLDKGTVIKGTTTNFDGATAILGGGNSLTLSGTGVTTIGGNVSGVGSLVRDAGTTTFGASAGSTAITVTTSGVQVYTGAISLNQNTTLTASSITSFTTAITVPGSTTITAKTLVTNVTP